MMSTRRWAGFGLVLGLLIAAPRGIAAQDSQFGIRSLGTPGRWESIRARSTGGAFGLFDALSPLTEAALLELRQLTASAAGATSYRSSEIAGAKSALRTSRFPVMSLGGPIGHRVALGAGFTTYLDRSYATSQRDSVAIRGVMEPFTDELSNDGAVTDVRFAAAFQAHRRLAIGGAIHLLEGSARATAARHFDDSTTYFNAVERQEVRYDGFGLSASVAAEVTGQLRVAGWFRSDTRLRTTARDVAVDRADLPTGFGAGARWAPTPSARIAGAVAWRSWSDAGANAYDTFGWSVGAELGSSQLPLRLGIRGGQLPFAPGGAAPTETGYSLGTARSFSQGRARIDFGIERLNRKGGGLTEGVWTFLMGLTVQP